MSDNFRNENGKLPDEEEIGFYGDSEDWLRIRDTVFKNTKTETTAEVPAEDTGEIRVFREKEPEEELAQWMGEQPKKAEYDPFFDPDLPDISRTDSVFFSAEDEQKPNKTQPGTGEKKKEAKKPGIIKELRRKKDPEKPLHPDKPDEKSDLPGEQDEIKSPQKNNKQKRRKKLLKGKIPKKTLIIAAAGAGVAVALFLIIFAVLQGRKPQEQEAAQPAEEVETIVTENTAVSSIRHLSFPRLCVEESNDHLSVNEFSQILDNLYENGYVLVDVYNLAQTDENGKMKMNPEVEIPEGKKPLIISQRDYPDTSTYDKGMFSNGLVIGDDGEIHSLYEDSEGNTAIGDLDIVPILEAFIIMHPDFTYKGARGIAALTGYNGLIGTAEPEAVIAKMKERGWRFASGGYEKISYGSEYSLVEQDALLWNENVKKLTGDTDIIILPRKTDIASWAPYSEENMKYKLLKNMGFKYFLVHTPETPGFLQVEKDYVRHAICEIDTMEEFEATMANEKF